MPVKARRLVKVEEIRSHSQAGRCLPQWSPSTCGRGQQCERFGFGIISGPLCIAPSCVSSSFQLFAQKCGHLSPLPLTHTFLKRPFLTDFKKYTHPPPPPKGSDILVHQTKSSKTPGKCQNPPSWRTMNVPERYFAFGAGPPHPLPSGLDTVKSLKPEIWSGWVVGGFQDPPPPGLDQSARWICIVYLSVGRSGSVVCLCICLSVCLSASEQAFLLPQYSRPLILPLSSRSFYCTGQQVFLSFFLPTEQSPLLQLQSTAPFCCHSASALFAATMQQAFCPTQVQEGFVTVVESSFSAATVQQPFAAAAGGISLLFFRPPHCSRFFQWPHSSRPFCS